MVDTGKWKRKWKLGDGHALLVVHVEQAKQVYDLHLKIKNRRVSGRTRRASGKAAGKR